MYFKVKSYLSNWKQYVSIKNCSSSTSNNALGVPQGSVLGLELFILYINYMSSSITDPLIRSWPPQYYLFIAVVIYFADDSTVFASDRDMNNVHATLNRELMGVDNWLKAGILSTNVSKTSYYMINSIQKNTFDITIRDSIITNISTRV